MIMIPPAILMVIVKRCAAQVAGKERLHRQSLQAARGGFGLLRSGGGQAAFQRIAVEVGAVVLGVADEVERARGHAKPSLTRAARFAT